jgi:hypothetical protein
LATIPAEALLLLVLLYKEQLLIVQPLSTEMPAGPSLNEAAPPLTVPPFRREMPVPSLLKAAQLCSVAPSRKLKPSPRLSLPEQFEREQALLPVNPAPAFLAETQLVREHLANI